MENKFSQLIEPFERKVREIREELYQRGVLKSGEEKILYGKFDQAYKQYSLEKFEEGKLTSHKDFFEYKISELKEIFNSVKSLEANINDKTGNEIKFHAIRRSILDVIEESKKMSQAYDSEDESHKQHIRTKKIYSYNWKLPKQKINDLYKQLKKESLIDKSTKYASFEMIFSSLPVTKIENKIVWSSSNATELLYFVLQLVNNEIVESSSKRMDYDKLKSCFVKENLEKFDVNFKSLRTDIEISLNIDKQRVIDNIIQSIIN